MKKPRTRQGLFCLGDEFQTFTNHRENRDFTQLLNTKPYRFPQSIL